MVRGILGNVHQGCEIFRPFKGMQCTAIALIALLTLSVDYNAQNMTASRIDSILHDGTELYASIIFALSGCVDTALDIKKKTTLCQDVKLLKTCAKRIMQIHFQFYFMISYPLLQR